MDEKMDNQGTAEQPDSDASRLTPEAIWGLPGGSEPRVLLADPESGSEAGQPAPPDDEPDVDLREWYPSVWWESKREDEPETETVEPAAETAAETDTGLESAEPESAEREPDPDDSLEEWWGSPSLSLEGLDALAEPDPEAEPAREALVELFARSVDPTEPESYEDDPFPADRESDMSVESPDRSLEAVLGEASELDNRAWFEQPTPTVEASAEEPAMDLPESWVFSGTRFVAGKPTGRRRSLRRRKTKPDAPQAPQAESAVPPDEDPSRGKKRRKPRREGRHLRLRRRHAQDQERDEGPLLPEPEDDRWAHELVGNSRQRSH